MTAKEEKAWSVGYRAALVAQLGHILREIQVVTPKSYSNDLSEGGSLVERARLILEREQAIATLRTLCAEHGVNDWPDDLHLSDIIEKNLVRPMLR